LSELHGTRKKIYEYVLEHPGSHFREIGRNMEIAIGDLQYHIDYLETMHYIISERHGFYKRFYPVRVYSDKQKAIMSALNRETPRKILMLLSQKPGVFHHEIASFVKLSPPTVSWNMKKLIEDGLVESRREGRNTRYFFVGSKQDVEEALKTYHSKFWLDWADRLADIWMDLSAVKEEEKDEE
jgi:predicted transcriptional regulator